MNMKTKCDECDGPISNPSLQKKYCRGGCAQKARNKKINMIKLLEEYTDKFRTVPSEAELEDYKIKKRYRTMRQKCAVCYSVMDNAPISKIYCSGVCQRIMYRDKKMKLDEQQFNNAFRDKYGVEPREFEREYYKVHKKLRQIPPEIDNFIDLRISDNRKRRAEIAKSVRSNNEVYEVAYKNWIGLSKVARAIMAEKIPIRKIADKTNLIALKDFLERNEIEPTGNQKALFYINQI